MQDLQYGKPGPVYDAVGCCVTMASCEGGDFQAVGVCSFLGVHCAAHADWNEWDKNQDVVVSSAGVVVAEGFGDGAVVPGEMGRNEEGSCQLVEQSDTVDGT